MEADAPARGPRAISVAGAAHKGAKQYQEDAFVHMISATEKVTIAAVFDGHGGKNGMVASNTARDTLVAYFRQRSDECERWEEAEWRARLLELFDTLHESIRAALVGAPLSETGGQPRVVDAKGIVRTQSGDPVHGGTTGSVVVMVQRPDSSCLVVTANVGDSAALLFRRDGQPPLPADAPNSYAFITVDHGPENPDEYARVQGVPGLEHRLQFVYDLTSVVRKHSCPRVFLKNGQLDQKFVENPWGNGLHPTNVRYEPAVYAVTPREVHRDTTCIAMTRALGDFYAHQFGLTHVPSVTSRVMPAGVDFTIVVASDGLWDCYKYHKLCEDVNARLNHSPLDRAVEETVAEAIRIAIASFGQKHYDDCAVVLVRCGY